MSKSPTLSTLDPNIRETVDRWMAFDNQTRKQIEALLRDNPQELVDAFYTSLSFGTGGLRGIMGVGSNRINRYTVQFATQGLANYLKQHGTGSLSVFIGYDCRHDSDKFAIEAARVLAGNGIRAYVTRDLRPTPLVSFACREKGCSAAIMITASHNPPAYNGYKVYWADGAQVLPPHDKGIIEQVSRIEGPSQVKLAEEDSPLIERVGSEIDQAYLEAISSLQNSPGLNAEKGKQLKVVFTNLHGTAATLVPQALERWGFSQIVHVESQAEPSGDFPTVDSPNPEEESALQMGIAKLCDVQGDLLLGCDPDADRMGAVVLHSGKPVLLNGNQIACLCLSHLCQSLSERGKLPEDAAFVKTIVTTELFKAIAEAYGRPCFDVLTGFKYIADLIRQWEEQGSYQYLFGGEESYGYLLGTHARDKDAVVSCALFCEAALHAKLQGRTLVDELHALYERFGIYREKLISMKFPESKAGREAMATAMRRLRDETPSEIGGCAVSYIEDYLNSERRYLKSGETQTLSLPQSNVLVYWLADKSKVVIRPSGTEPKVKLYCGVQRSEGSVEEADAIADNYLASLQALLS